MTSPVARAPLLVRGSSADPGQTQSWGAGRPPSSWTSARGSGKPRTGERTSRGRSSWRPGRTAAVMTEAVTGRGALGVLTYFAPDTRPGYPESHPLHGPLASLGGPGQAGVRVQPEQEPGGRPQADARGRDEGSFSTPTSRPSSFPDQARVAFGRAPRARRAGKGDHDHRPPLPSDAERQRQRLRKRRHARDGQGPQGPGGQGTHRRAEADDPLRLGRRVQRDRSLRPGPSRPDRRTRWPSSTAT